MTQLLSKIFERYLPSAFSLAVLLSVVVFTSALFFTENTFLDLAIVWQNGLWNLLAFAMQMCLILITGFTLARSNFVLSVLDRLSSLLQTPFKAIIGVSLLSALASMINWGMGLVVGAILARSIGSKVKSVDYRVLVAAAYSGFVFWHGGLSGSIPLTLAEGGESLIQTTNGLLSQAIPIEETLFSSINLSIIGLLLILIPLFNYLMHPKAEQVISLNYDNDDASFSSNANLSSKEALPWVQRMEESPFIIKLLGFSFFGLVLVKWFFMGFDLGLNTVILCFLSISMILHQKMSDFFSAFEEGLKGCSGIVLQFPFYAGIMAIMAAEDGSGVSLAAKVIEVFAENASEKTLPVLSFFSAGFLNVLIPSGGGQWALQAPIMLAAAQQTGSSLTEVSLAIAWGDAWTNMIQPFWALPLLAIAKLDARDIMGYCLLILFVVGIVVSSVFWLL